MKYPTFLICAFASSLLLGCTASTSIKATDVNVETTRQDKYISTQWITKYRAEVTKQIVGYVKTQYPTIPSGLPKLEVSSVQIKNDVLESNRAAVNEVAPVLRAMLQDVSDKVLNTRGTDILILDIEITFLSPTELSTGTQVAASVTLMPICWGTLLVACPTKNSNYVHLNASVKRHGQVLGNVNGIGGATRFISTPLVDDTSDPKANGSLDANTKALAAAVADLGGKLKPYILNVQHP